MQKSAEETIEQGWARNVLKRYGTVLGIICAFVLMALVSGSYLDFSYLETGAEFPGGFAWLIEHFWPDEQAYGQLGRIWQALFTTLLDAIAAGTLAAVVGFILAVIGSRVTGFGGIVQLVIRAFATVLRNIPTVAWGFLLLFSFKQAEFTGFLALFFKGLGFLTRAMMETIDETGREAIEALEATGATRVQIVFRGVFPLVRAQLMSWVLYTIETNFRDATLVGMLTGTGIGFVFNWYYRTFKYPTAGLVIICIAITVLAVELVSNYLRRRIDRPDGRCMPLRHRRDGSVRVSVPAKSRLLIEALALALALLTLFTFIQMDFGHADLAKATGNFFKYLGIMFLQPHLQHYTLQEMLDGLAVTLSIAALTTFGGTVIALVLSVLAASNLTNRTLSYLIKLFMALIRSVPTIVWALVFTVAIGLGPEAAVVGMMFHTVSFLTKSFSEAFEAVDPDALDALKSTGSTWWQRVFCGVFSEKFSEMVSWIFIRFENNFVGAVTVGAVAGSGGIGYQLYMLANYMFDWHEVGFVIYLCLAVSITLELIAGKLRRHFIGSGSVS